MRTQSRTGRRNGWTAIVARMKTIERMKPKSELILYQTEDNRTRIEVRLENETVWQTVNQLAELFQRDKSVISKHSKNL